MKPPPCSPYSDRIAVVLGECCQAEVCLVDAATIASQLNFAHAGIALAGKVLLTLDGRVGTPEGDFFHALATQPPAILFKDWGWSPQGDRLAVIHTQAERADAATLSEIDLSPSDSPAWKLSTDGQGELETLIEAGFFADCAALT